MQTQTTNELAENEREQAAMPSFAQQPIETNTEETSAKETHDTLAKSVDSVKAQAVVAKLKRQARIRWRLNFVYAVVLLTTMTCTSLFRSTSPLNACYWSIVMLASGLFYLAAWLQMRQANKVIENINDVKLAGPLAEALDAERFIKPKQVVAALRRLLPRLQASDAALLTREQRACLYRAINRQSMRSHTLYDTGLALDVLKALQQIGDKDALPHVQRAAKWSQNKNIHRAANDCMQFLMEKAEAHKRSEQYLRPSSASTAQMDQADVLVRPASASTEQTAPEQLLRASKNRE